MGATVTFGEMMVRLEPPGFRRLAQGLPGILNASFVGAEANVAVGISQLGGDARYVTALPDNPVADALCGNLTGLGVDTASVIRIPGSRLGVLYTERGANQRPSVVLYDRTGSAIATAGSDMYDWDSAFGGVSWFHVTGITPAVSESAAVATKAAVATAAQRGISVSCDLNFRSKLWNWDGRGNPQALAQSVMPNIVSATTLLIGNEQDASDVLGVAPSSSDVEKGKLSHEDYVDVARRTAAKYPRLATIAFTLRESVSASHNRWGAMLYSVAADVCYFAPMVDGEYLPYEITDIVDRVGGGDAFAAGLIWALQSSDFCEPSSALAFATAASCLSHSIEGDFNFINRADVEKLLTTGGSGRVVR